MYFLYNTGEDMVPRVDEIPYSETVVAEAAEQFPDLIYFEAELITKGVVEHIVHRLVEDGWMSSFDADDVIKDLTS
jgi:hypothetical protein